VQALGLLDALVRRVDTLDRLGNRGLGKQVARDDRDVEPASAEKPADELEVVQSLRHGGEVVLVFVLDADDIAAPADLELREARQQVGQVLVVIMRVGGVGGPIGHPALGRQPARQAAEVPLAADIRTRAENHIQAQLTGEANKPGHVPFALEVPLALLRLMEVPWDVRADAVQARPLGL